MYHYLRSAATLPRPVVARKPLAAKGLSIDRQANIRRCMPLWRVGLPGAYAPPPRPVICPTQSTTAIPLKPVLKHKDYAGLHDNTAPGPSLFALPWQLIVQWHSAQSFKVMADCHMQALRDCNGRKVLKPPSLSLIHTRHNESLVVRPGRSLQPLQPPGSIQTMNGCCKTSARMGFHT